jgi:hypothetical protein
MAVLEVEATAKVWKEMESSVGVHAVAVRAVKAVIGEGRSIQEGVGVTWEEFQEGIWEEVHWAVRRVTEAAMMAVLVVEATESLAAVYAAAVRAVSLV